MATKTVLGRLGLTAAACLMAGAAWAYPAQVSQDLNMRTGPGTGYRVVTVLPGGAIVEVEGCRGSWCRVDYRGRQGWASARYLGEPRTARGPVYRDPGPVYRDPAPVYRTRPAPGVTFEFGFGGRRYDDDWYDDRYEHRRPRGRVVARRDRDGDGYYETIRIRRPDGSVVVRRDLDGDGLFDDVVRRF